jgi:hypothetical protein
MITLISGGIELEAKLLIKRGKDLKCGSAEREDLIIKKAKETYAQGVKLRISCC